MVFHLSAAFQPFLLLLLPLLLLSRCVSAQQVNLVPFVESLNIVEEAFTRRHCAVREGSLGTELSPLPQRWSGLVNRKLLRFTVGIQNSGKDDLELRREEHPDWFEWGECHRHWHFKDFTNYELMDSSGRDVVTGRKQAFCLMDIRRFDRSAPNLSPRHSCSNPGISAGWADLYSYSLDGQWIDITDVPAGPYTLQVTVNHGKMLNETNFDDNTATVEVVIPGLSSSSNTEFDLLTSAGSAQLDPRAVDNMIPTPRSNRQCLPIFEGCRSNENCCSEICMHQSGEIKTSTAGPGGRCVCVRPGGRCAGEHNCCGGLRCDNRNNRCRGRMEFFTPHSPV